MMDPLYEEAVEELEAAHASPDPAAVLRHARRATECAIRAVLLSRGIPAPTKPDPPALTAAALDAGLRLPEELTAWARGDAAGRDAALIAATAAVTFAAASRSPT